MMYDTVKERRAYYASVGSVTRDIIMSTYRIGPIRPPSEAQSLLLQITQGCTWNKCKFCNLYRGTQFKTFSADSIKRDIDTMAEYAEKVMSHRIGGAWDFEGLNADLSRLPEDEANCYYSVANWLLNGGETVFLQDGNSLVLRDGRLSEVLKYLRETFPSIKRVTSYGRAENLAKITAEEYAELKEAGLDRIHSGFETGSDAVLQLVNKGVTAAEEIIAGQNIKAGGLELSVYFMPGLGGKRLSEDNAKGMANVVSQVNPDFVRIRTAAVKPETDLYEDFLSGNLVLCSEDEKVLELRTLIEETKGVTTRLVSDHMINLLQDLEGSLDYEKPEMLAHIDKYLALPEVEKKRFQLARRLRYVNWLSDMPKLQAGTISQFDEVIKSIPDQADWDIKMNEIIGRYI